MNIARASSFEARANTASSPRKDNAPAFFPMRGRSARRLVARPCGQMPDPPPDVLLHEAVNESMLKICHVLLVDVISTPNCI